MFDDIRSLFCKALVLGAMSFATFKAGATMYYVSPAGQDKNVGTNWASAKATIQAAITAATNNDLIVVTNGLYATGGTPYNNLTNRVAITKPVTVRSVNGPLVTTIMGLQQAGSTNGPLAMRCAYVGGGATLSGFTLTGGATHGFDGADMFVDRTGGGVLNDGVVENCIITGNSGAQNGGCYGGTLNNCIISRNVGTGFFHPGFGWVPGVGGVVSSGLNNCLLNNNWGGEASAVGPDSALYNCTVTANTSTNVVIEASTLVNCIVYYNTNSHIPPTTAQMDTNCEVSYTCSTPLFPGTGNFSNAPIFVSSNNFRLGPFSPCTDVGADIVPGFTDLDGLPRMFRKIDLGCYERQIPGDINNDGLVNLADLTVLLTNYSSTVDQAAVSAVLSNYWPNRLLLAMTNVAGLGGSNVTFALTNSNAGAYSVQYSTNLTSWQTLGAAIPRYSFIDTNAGPGAQRFYRLNFP